LINSFVRVRGVNPGFDADQALTFRIGLPETTYVERARRIAFYDRLPNEPARCRGSPRAGP
jgi:hypothetical protein